MTEQPMPAAFLGHGNPMKELALERLKGHDVAGRWRQRDSAEVGHEVFVSGELLGHEAQDVMATRLHDAAHAVAYERKVQDTSWGGRYHNARYRALATALGRTVERAGAIGWSQASQWAVRRDRPGQHPRQRRPARPDPCRRRAGRRVGPHGLLRSRRPRLGGQQPRRRRRRGPASDVRRHPLPGRCVRFHLRRRMTLSARPWAGTRRVLSARGEALRARPRPGSRAQAQRIGAPVSFTTLLLHSVISLEKPEQ
jgi:hypothetical protein